VYLTFYSGNRLPPFYIGCTKVSNIDRGYHGSVSSKKYKNIWKSELENNPHLFKTSIITYHKTQKDAIEREKKFQLHLNVIKNQLYINMAIGYYSDNTGRIVSEETRRKISNKNKGRKLPLVSNDTRKKLSDANKGRNLSQDHKNKISETLTGHNVSDKTKHKIKIARKQQIISHSEETRRKMSLAAKGKKKSAEHRRKISEAQKGKSKKENGTN
jgi:hypothetical protein